MLKKHLFALITVACLTMLTSCVRETKAASEQTAVPVQVRTPAVVERAESVSASGSVEGSETADVAFLVGGRVPGAGRRGPAREQRTVAGGNRTDRLPKCVQRGDSAEGGGAGGLEQKADAGLRKQELEQARIDFERWQDEYKRMKFLVERKSLPPNDFQKIEAAYNASKERYEMAQEGTRKEDHRHGRCAGTCRRRPGERGKQAAERHATSRADFRQHQHAKSRPGTDGRRRNAGLLHRRTQPGQGARGSSRGRNRKSPPRRHCGGLRAFARRTLLQRKGGDHRRRGEPASRTYTVKILVPNPGPVLLAGMVAEARIFGPAKIRASDHPG